MACIEAGLQGKVPASILSLSGARQEQALLGKTGILTGFSICTEKLLVQEVKRGGKSTVVFWVSDRHLQSKFVEKAIENCLRHVPAELGIKVHINVILIDQEPSSELLRLLANETVDGSLYIIKVPQKRFPQHLRQ